MNTENAVFINTENAVFINTGNTVFINGILNLRMVRMTQIC